MLRLDKVIKPWKESAALNDHINLYGFWNETAFLTKSGDLGMVLSVPGVDYESLDRSEQEYAVKRLEAALKAFGPGFHVCQYLFKSNRPDIPFAKYDDPIVEAAIDQRRKFFEAKRDHLYQVEIFYCILLEGARSKTGVGAAIARILRDPAGAVGELKVQFTNDSMKTLLGTHIEHDLRRLDQSVQAFARQLSDFMQIEILNQQGQFMFFRRLLNYDDWRVAGRPQSTQFLDYQVVNSDIEAERDHLRVGDHIVRVLTMKEAINETRPLVLDALLKIPANFYVVTEWTPLPADKARKEVNKRRRHFNMSKTGFVSQMGNDATTTNPRDVLVDESKQADIENLGDCLRALGDGQSLGDFSLTIVLYGRSRTELDQLVAEFTGVFTNADGNLFAETYNQLNAYFATVPGNYALNLRQLYLLNTNYADLSFLFTILPGEKTNAHLGTEYLAVLETDNSTPYFLNLHTSDVAHTLILGMTGSGKTTFLSILTGVLGTYAKRAQRGTFMLKRGDEGQPFDYAGLEGCRAFIASETEEGKTLSVAKVKEITGNEASITACRKFRDSYEFKPKCKVWLACNDFPKAPAGDEALWDRLKPVPFNVKFRDTQSEIKDLAEKLVQEEGSGILNWMLRGLEEYMDIGLAVPEEAKQKAQELRDEQDFLGRFLDERTARTDANGEMVLVSRLYDTFKMHSDATGEGRGWTRTKFNSEMRAKGYEDKKVRVGDQTPRVWVGVKLVSTISADHFMSNADLL